MPPKGSKRKAEPAGDTPAKRPIRRSSKQQVLLETKQSPKEAETETETETAKHIPSTANHDDFVLREFYPPEMTNERVQAYKGGSIQTPYDELTSALKDTESQRAKIKPNKAIAHWFRWDLRLADNTGLYKAYTSAKANKVPLICLFVFSHQNYRAHYTSPARIDFALRTLKILKEDLRKLDIPLWVEEVTERKRTSNHIFDWCQKWGVSELHANMEYEVDELRRDAKLVREGIEKDIAVNVYHDTCVVEPMVLRSGTGKTYSVFTPFFKSWEPYIAKNRVIENLFPVPKKNDPKLETKETFKDLFDQLSFPTPSEDKQLSEKDTQRLAKLWPAGEHEAKSRLQLFLDERVSKYADRRDRPDIENGTSALSVHFAAGTLSARQAVRATEDHGKGKSLDAGHHGWIRELCFRDFYKGILATNPHVCMNKAYHEEYHNVVWEYDDEQFQRWVEGKTGYPIVDAAMRQLAGNKYMHNRCRMIVASFLCKDLLLDWRKGEKYFMETLIDGDFASNNAGWQFCSSSGTDAQPYFRIFNPLTQSEKFDPNGDYIRRWVPELRKVEGKAIHEPYARLSANEFKKLNYPKPIIEHKFARERALERYKTGLGRNTR
ncbi:Cryptochrome-2 [Dactylellina cionopaga]|nr:Cryptochrome-2 [Dactylellina cionopaga]